MPESAVHRAQAAAREPLVGDEVTMNRWIQGNVRGKLLRMGRVLPILLLIACTIYTAVHVVQSDSEQVRGVPKALWLVIVICVPLVGMVAWWVFGRPTSTQPPPPMAPDDDTDFLRHI